MKREQIISEISNGQAILGIELGSTRIKAVLIGSDFSTLAEGSFGWENHLEDGLWSYYQEEIFEGLQACYADLLANVKSEYGIGIETLKSIGISGMMHGHLAFDEDYELLVPFRTWRNTNAVQAAKELIDLFDYNIPARWSIAHLYQAILNGEEHVRKINYITTLAGYVHLMLTGERVTGIGDASGMFPIDPEINDYHQEMLDKFDEKIKDYGFPWKIRDIMPKALAAGENAGYLTDAGAMLLDESGTLKPGIPLCPPEGDADTGMVATNSIRERTGNISAGTSVFGMIVLEKPLSKVYPQIDIFATPSGHLTAQAHGNNGATDLDAWIGMLGEFAGLSGANCDKGELYSMLFNEAMKGDKDCGGMLSYNWYAGEMMVDMDKGVPLFTRTPDVKISLANFIRSQLYGCVSILKIGVDMLSANEGVKVDTMLAHGGFFKTPKVMQSILAAALDTPVTVMSTAGEGGAWGIALLAAYMADSKGKSLEDFLDDEVFDKEAGITIKPDPEDVAGFNKYIELYKKVLPAEGIAADALTVK